MRERRHVRDGDDREARGRMRVKRCKSGVIIATKGESRRECAGERLSEEQRSAGDEKTRWQ